MTVSRLRAGMLKIGKKLSTGQPDTIIDKWETNFPDSMPSNERVNQLMETPELVPLAKFLEIFETPVDIVMEADRVWPPAQPVPY